MPTVAEGRSLRTILIVDDEPEVREVLREVLADPGRTVLVAASGQEALRILAERHVDLLVTDVRLGGMDGFALGRRAKRLRPTLQIVFMSGIYDAQEADAAAPLGPLFKKPLGKDALDAVISRIFRRNPEDSVC